MIWDGKSASRKNDKYAAPNADDWRQITKEVISIQKVLNVYSNNSGAKISIGQPLILESNIQLAHSLNPEVIGLSIINCVINEDCIYITQGQLSLENWQRVTGTVELIPGAYYYLSQSEEGKLTAVPPDINSLVQIGRAQNKNTFDVNIQAPIYF